jgi:hypothetical protein
MTKIVEKLIKVESQKKLKEIVTTLSTTINYDEGVLRKKTTNEERIDLLKYHSGKTKKIKSLIEKSKPLYMKVYSKTIKEDDMIKYLVELIKEQEEKDE